MMSLKNNVLMLRTVDLILLNLKRDGYFRIIRNGNFRPISAFDYRGKQRICIQINKDAYIQLPNMAQ